MKKAKRRTKYLLLFLILFISVGYAILQSNLSITGTTSIQDSKWDIHWNNVVITEGSVSTSNADKATIDSSKTTVNYNIVLDKPGDFYEFTVDAVNAGTIDGMIDVISSKLNNVEITTLPAYLNYSITYSDGTPLQGNQLLAANSSETYKVRIEYKRDIQANQLPETTQTLNLSFSVTYKQADGNAIEINHLYLYNILKNAADEGTYAKKYTGSHHDSFTEEPSKDIYYWWADNDTNGESITDMNNVIFAGFCWQMIRTTDTGGVKIIYNGDATGGKCNNMGEYQQIGKYQYNTDVISPAYLGYMYNPNTLIICDTDGEPASGSLFGTGVTYSGGNYTLTSTSTTYDAKHHYTCNNATGTCSTIRYYYYDNYYVEIDDGRTIEQVLTDMLSADDVNQTNSEIKTYVDNWYQNNMTSYTSTLEDTIFCNDRSISRLGGWNPKGGSISANLIFHNGYSFGNLQCSNETDKFSVSNLKAKLTYPVGLASGPEMYIMNNNIIRKTGQTYWLLSPAVFDITDAHAAAVGSDGSDGGVLYIANKYGIRPVVSLKPGIIYTGGDGSKNNPYIVE